LQPWRSWSCCTKRETFGCFLGIPSPILAPFAPKRKLSSCARWRPPGRGCRGMRHLGLLRGAGIGFSAPQEPALLSRSFRGLDATRLARLGPSRGTCESSMKWILRDLEAISLARLGPSRGTWRWLVKMGRPGLVKAPRHGPQAGKSGYPGSQNADSSPRAQGVLGLGFQAKPKRQGRRAVGPQSLRA
jgi:hypothetical protein